MKVEIRKFDDLTEKRWYTSNSKSNYDSQATFKGSCNIFLRDEKFKELFQTSDNGGSYAVNFDSKRLKEVEDFCRENNIEIVFVKQVIEVIIPTIKIISREEYLNQKVKNDKDGFTEYIMNAFI